METKHFNHRASVDWSLIAASSVTKRISIYNPINSGELSDSFKHKTCSQQRKRTRSHQATWNQQGRGDQTDGGIQEKGEEGLESGECRNIDIDFEIMIDKHQWLQPTHLEYVMMMGNLCRSLADPFVRAFIHELCLFVCLAQAKATSSRTPLPYRSEAKMLMGWLHHHQPGIIMLFITFPETLVWTIHIIIVLFIRSTIVLERICQNMIRIFLWSGRTIVLERISYIRRCPHNQNH